MKFFRLSWLALVPVLGAVSLSVLCPPLHSQNLAVGFSGSIPIDTLESMNDTFQVADRASRVDLLKRLGVDADIAEDATSFVPPPAIAIRPIRNHSRQLFGIVTLPCGVRSETFLYLLGKDDHSQWHVVDSARLGCFTATQTVSLLSFVPGVDDVFVQHANTGHGTNELEDSATLYTVRKGHLREILSTPDHTVRGGLIDVPVVDQTSTFLQLPGQLIEETRVSSNDGLPRRAERRLWRWQAKQRLFRAAPFHEIREPEQLH
jgi:hypothetical protein